MSVNRGASASPLRRIPRKPVSPTTRNHAQHVKNHSSPSIGRRPLPGLPVHDPDLKIQNSPGSPVRLHIQQPDEWSYPTGFTAEFNDSRDTRRSRRFSSGEQYFSAQEDPWNTTPPPPPPHLQLNFADENDFDFSHEDNFNAIDEFQFPMPGQYLDSLRVREGNPARREERMRENRQSEETSTWEVFPEPVNMSSENAHHMYDDSTYHTSQNTRYHTPEDSTYHTPEGSTTEGEEEDDKVEPLQEPLQYHHMQAANDHFGVRSTSLVRRKPLPPQVEPLRLHAAHNRAHYTPSPQYARQRSANLRPVSSYSASSEFGSRGRSPAGLGYIPPSPGLRVRSTHSRASLDNRPTSSVLDLNASYRQASPNPISLEESNAALRLAVGANASLLSTHKTLEMYLKNVNKSQDPETQFSFALLLIERAKEIGLSNPSTQNNSSESLTKKSEKRPSRELDSDAPPSSANLIAQAKTLLKSLADRSFPFAQYILADGYANGLFSKNGEADWDRAFPLFVAASKHGHTESGYRAGLCYEFGWGCRRDPSKAEQFYRQSASKNHTGAMTRLGRAFVYGDLGQRNHREGFKWLRRAAESADTQYNSAPYYLGVLYANGHGDDIIKDEAYAAELFTKAARLGHAEAGFRMGDAYEYGKLACPVDPFLSVHFYNDAARLGHPKAMMGLCSWYLDGVYVDGVESYLQQDYDEAYLWASKAAEMGLPKAEYTMGWFAEKGIGCRTDILEAKMWYVRAAEHGETRATTRIKNINDAGAGNIDGALRPGTANKANKVPLKSVSTPNFKAPVDMRKPSEFPVPKTRKQIEEMAREMAKKPEVYMPPPPFYTDIRKYGLKKENKKETATITDPVTSPVTDPATCSVADPVTERSERLEVPAPTQQHQPRTSSLRSDEPSPVPVTTGGPRFSLDESPQKPKKGVLKKKRVQDDGFEGDVVYVGMGQKDEKFGGIGGVGGKEEKVGGGGGKEEKRKWFGRWA